MDLLKLLSDLGFDNAAVLDLNKGLCRIMTSNGWVYERFPTEESVSVWARDHKPEDKD